MEYSDFRNITHSEMQQISNSITAPTRFAGMMFYPTQGPPPNQPPQMQQPPNPAPMPPQQMLPYQPPQQANQPASYMDNSYINTPNHHTITILAVCSPCQHTVEPKRLDPPFDPRVYIVQGVHPSYAMPQPQPLNVPVQQVCGNQWNGMGNQWPGSMNQWYGGGFPQNGIGNTFSANVNQCFGGGSPQNVMAHPQNGMANPQNAISHPYNGSGNHGWSGNVNQLISGGYPHNSMAHPQNHMDNQQNGMANHQNGSSNNEWPGNVNQLTSGGYPHNSMAHPQNGMAYPQNGIAHQQNGTGINEWPVGFDPRSNRGGQWNNSANWQQGNGQQNSTEKQRYDNGYRRISNGHQKQRKPHQTPDFLTPPHSNPSANRSAPSASPSHFAENVGPTNASNGQVANQMENLPKVMITLEESDGSVQVAQSVDRKYHPPPPLLESAESFSTTERDMVGQEKQLVSKSTNGLSVKNQDRDKDEMPQKISSTKSEEVALKKKREDVDQEKQTIQLSDTANALPVENQKLPEKEVPRNITYTRAVLSNLKNHPPPSLLKSAGVALTTNRDAVAHEKQTVPLLPLKNQDRPKDEVLKKTTDVKTASANLKNHHVSSTTRKEVELKTKGEVVGQKQKSVQLASTTIVVSVKNHNISVANLGNRTVSSTQNEEVALKTVGEVVDRKTGLSSDTVSKPFLENRKLPDDEVSLETTNDSLPTMDLDNNPLESTKSAEVVLATNGEVVNHWEEISLSDTESVLSVDNQEGPEDVIPENSETINASPQKLSSTAAKKQRKPSEKKKFKVKERKAKPVHLRLPNFLRNNDKGKKKKHCDPKPADNTENEKSQEKVSTEEHECPLPEALCAPPTATTQNVSDSGNSDRVTVTDVKTNSDRAEKVVDIKEEEMEADQNVKLEEASEAEDDKEPCSSSPAGPTSTKSKRRKKKNKKNKNNSSQDTGAETALQNEADAEIEDKTLTDEEIQKLLKFDTKSDAFSVFSFYIEVKNSVINNTSFIDEILNETAEILRPCLAPNYESNEQEAMRLVGHSCKFLGQWYDASICYKIWKAKHRPGLFYKFEVLVRDYIENLPSGITNNKKKMKERAVSFLEKKKLEGELRHQFIYYSIEINWNRMFIHPLYYLSLHENQDTFATLEHEFFRTLTQKPDYDSPR